MSYFIKVLKNYAVFSGRARRMEYWYFQLFWTIFSIKLFSVQAKHRSILLGRNNRNLSFWPLYH